MFDEPGSWVWGRSSRSPADTEIVAPAFSSRSQTIFFVLLLVFCVSLPKLVDWSGLISRTDSYDIMPENLGAFSFVKNEIFGNNEEVDLLFVGSSVMFGGIDTPEVQTELSEHLGRRARVFTFGHYFNSEDMAFLQVRDLLERKRVRMIVISIPRMPFPDGPSPPVFRFVRYSEVSDLMSGLPLRYRGSLYGCNILRSPRDLRTIISNNRTPPSPWTETLGADKAELGPERDPKRFERFTPMPRQISTGDMIYSDRTRENFQILNDPIGTYQEHYLEELVRLTRAKGVPLVILNIPQSTERHSKKVLERGDWSKKFGTDIALVGVPPAVLFAGLDDTEIDKLFFDPSHFNANGNEFFTRTIAPAILEVYDRYALKD